MYCSILSRRPARPTLAWALVAGILVGCGDEVGTSEPDAVATLAIVSAPAASLTGAPLPEPVVVELRTADGQPVALEGIQVSASVSLGHAGGTTTATTNAEGRAIFSGLVITGQDAETILRFFCCGIPPATQPISLLQTRNLLSRASPATIQARAGSVVTPGPAVRLIDERLAPVAGREITFTLLQDGSFPLGTAVTDANGTAALPSLELVALPGQGRIFAVAGGTTLSVWFDVFTTVSGSVEVLDAEPLAAPAGSAFELPVVRVTDGGPVAGATVRYRVIAGDATLSTETVLTDANGEAAPIALNVVRGRNVVEIVAPGYSPSPRYVNVFGVSGPVTLTGAIGDSWYFSQLLPAIFDWSDDSPAWVVAAAQDPEGVLTGFPLQLVEIGEAGQFSTWNAIQIVSGTTIVAGEGFYWQIPAARGSYEVHVTGPMIETPLVFRATRP